MMMLNDFGGFSGDSARLLHSEGQTDTHPTHPTHSTLTLIDALLVALYQDLLVCSSRNILTEPNKVGPVTWTAIIAGLIKITSHEVRSHRVGAM